MSITSATLATLAEPERPVDPVALTGYVTVVPWERNTSMDWAAGLPAVEHDGHRRVHRGAGSRASDGHARDLQHRTERSLPARRLLPVACPTPRDPPAASSGKVQGTSRDPRHTIRIGFVRGEKGHRVIVGFIGLRQRNRQS